VSAKKTGNLFSSAIYDPSIKKMRPTDSEQGNIFVIPLTPFMEPGRKSLTIICLALGIGQ
jgi:hypothetical protein